MELISLERILRRSRSTYPAYRRYSDTELASDTVILSSSTVTTPWFLCRFPYASSCRLRKVVRRVFSLTVEKIRFREKRKWIQDKNYLNQETLSGKFFLYKFANIKNINYFCSWRVIWGYAEKRKQAMDFRHPIVTCLFSMLRLSFETQKVKENYAIFLKKERKCAFWHTFFLVFLIRLSDPLGILLVELPRWYLQLYIFSFKHIPWIIPLICYVLLR